MPVVAAIGIVRGVRTAPKIDRSWTWRERFANLSPSMRPVRRLMDAMQLLYGSVAMQKELDRMYPFR